MRAISVDIASSYAEYAKQFRKGVKALSEMDLFAPLNSLRWVDRDMLKPNNYNPNKGKPGKSAAAGAINTDKRLDASHCRASGLHHY